MAGAGARLDQRKTITTRLASFRGQGPGKDLSSENDSQSANWKIIHFNR